MSSKKFRIETPGKASVSPVLERMKEALRVADDAELGLALGVAAGSTFKVWRNRGAIPSGYYAKVAEQSGRSIQWLKTGEDVERELRNETSSQPLAEAFVMVPRYDVHASAGGGSLIHSELIVDYLAFRQEWVTKLGLVGQKLALIEVRGDSMEPALQSKDLVLIDLQTCELSVDGIYVIQHRGHLLVKRIQSKLDGTVIIKSDNHAYESESLTADEAERLIIVGRVVWFGRQM